MRVPLFSPFHIDYSNRAQFQSWSFNSDRPCFPGWIPKMGCFEKCTDVEEWGGRNFCGKVEVRGLEMKGWIPVILLLLQIMLCLNSPPRVLICYTGANPYIYALLVWFQSGLIHLTVKTKTPPYLLPALSLYHNFWHFLWLIIGPVVITEAEDESSEGRKASIFNEIHFSGDQMLLENSSQAPAFRLPISASPCLYASTPSPPLAVLCSHQDEGTGSTGWNSAAERGDAAGGSSLVSFSPERGKWWAVAVEDHAWDSVSLTVAVLKGWSNQQISFLHSSFWAKLSDADIKLGQFQGSSLTNSPSNFSLCVPSQQSICFCPPFGHFLTHLNYAINLESLPSVLERAYQGVRTIETT